MSKAVVKQDLKTEALKLALECVEAWDRGCDRNTYWRDIEAAVTAIREALAHAPEVREQPAQTATYTCGVCGVSMQMEQPAQQQEPVGAVTVSHYKGLENRDFDYWGSLPDGTYNLYTSPPASKPLTDEQFAAEWRRRVDEVAHGIKGKNA